MGQKHSRLRSRKAHSSRLEPPALTSHSSRRSISSGSSILFSLSHHSVATTTAVAPETTAQKIRRKSSKILLFRPSSSSTASPPSTPTTPSPTTPVSMSSIQGVPLATSHRSMNLEIPMTGMYPETQTHTLASHASASPVHSASHRIPRTLRRALSLTGRSGARPSSPSLQSTCMTLTVPDTSCTPRWGSVPVNLLLDEETEKLELQHNILRYTLRRNHFVHLDQPQSILHIGCGTGIWLREMAQDYPQCQFLGIDWPTPALFNEQYAPGNVRFKGHTLVDRPFPTQPNSFSLCRIALQLPTIDADTYRGMLHEAYMALEPRGWMEVIEMGVTLLHQPTTSSESPAIRKLNGWIRRVCRRQGILGFDDGCIPEGDDSLSLSSAPCDPWVDELYRIMREAGFTSMQSREIRLTVGPGVVGQLTWKSLEQSWHGVGGLRDMCVHWGICSRDEWAQCLYEISDLAFAAGEGSDMCDGRETLEGQETVRSLWARTIVAKWMDCSGEVS
ncbi:S-adenosyl-L-methionine-dependent methyltransferase [Piptocephalis cylindrospora]|uniref:S-adenosyl-L-methionine-dependent methyltransferase n=1 Tax=Piptocephalis cylindrospora TaxID=1907219 RepID=A0A4P9XYJ4_9FUNG|nr:S-adenosyl-L-methionine-dependent methyltransferase [Piptocephalis cylindrospora]|eukprot:RKP11496.1 S-adenosyl-L-methionine-dependent methyltransferase [Piptocephalis cylindrospora]